MTRPIYCCEGCGRDTTSKTRYCDLCRGDRHERKPRPHVENGYDIHPDEEGDVPLVEDDDYHGEVYRDDV